LSPVVHGYPHDWSVEILEAMFGDAGGNLSAESLGKAIFVKDKNSICFFNALID